MSKFPKHKPKQTEFIQQRYKSDCGIACVAMIVGELYETSKIVFNALNKTTRGGLYPEDVMEVLEEFGYNYKDIAKLPKNGKALVAIQWINQKLSGHYVVWDGKRKQFLDPLYGVFNKKEMLKCANIEWILKVNKRGG